MEGVTELGFNTAGAFSTGIVCTFSLALPEAGDLIVVHYSNDPSTSGTRLPNQGGYSTLAFFGGSPTYVWAKVSDGTETQVSVTHGSSGRQTAITACAVKTDLSSWEGPSAQSRPDAADMVVASGPVNARFDFCIGDDAPAPGPTTAAPAAETIRAHAGSSQRRASSWTVIDLGGDQPTGATILGETYVNMNNVGNGAWSFLLQVDIPGGWWINRIPMVDI